MPRIYRPEGRDVNKPTIQAQLGCLSCNLIHKGRGEFIGLEEIKQFVSPKDMKIAVLELGILMGLIHFHGNNDAYDVELFLGKEEKSKKCRFYLADFDLSENVKSYDESTVNRLTWSLDAVPYFPRDSVDHELFEIFREGYLSVAPSEELVNKIFEYYD